MNITIGPFACPFDAWRPNDGCVFRSFAFDAETTRFDDEHPEIIPDYIIGAACDDDRGVYVSRDRLLPFFQAHRDVPFVMHNAAFDLRVINAVLKPTIDIYESVEKNLAWDTLILNRLYSLATAGHTARGESSLADCANKHLRVNLDKDQKDGGNMAVRTNFGQFLGRPPSEIPAAYLEYMAHDSIITWHLFRFFHEKIGSVLQNCASVHGYVSEKWLEYVRLRFGPLTHHIQLRASILMDALRSNGIGIDLNRREEKAAKVKMLLDGCKERLRQKHGYLLGEPGSAKAMQSILGQLKRADPQLALQRTPSGRWSTAEKDLAELADQGGFFADFSNFKMAEKFLSTYLTKMERPRLHPKFGYLLETGRTYCGGGFNLQNLPREKDERDFTSTIRGCFVAGDGNVYIDCDYGQIELVVLGYVSGSQLGIPSRLARLINEGNDVHRLIAAAVLNKNPKDITKAERDSAKPVSFGRPGGMGVGGLRRVAKNGYGIELTDEQVQGRIDAYHRLCPELTRFLRDEIDANEVIASRLDLTPRRYYRAINKYYDEIEYKNRIPAGFLGGMLLKVLRDKAPQTSSESVRPYSSAEIEFFWRQAQQLPHVQPPLSLPPKLQSKLDARQADQELFEFVRDWAGRRSVFTVTGRLRANTTYCSSRNTMFQGAAADGAILGLWLVWRAGYKIVDFVHDQLVVESADDGKVDARVSHIEHLMKTGMLMIVPGMNVQVESVVTCSLNKKDVALHYDGMTKEMVNEQAPTPPDTGAVLKKIPSCELASPT